MSTTSTGFRLCSLSSLLENWKIGRHKVPVYVLLSLFAASGGLMFGYDIGISGGVTVMDDFLCKFFPGVLKKKMEFEGPGGNISIITSEKCNREAHKNYCMLKCNIALECNITKCNKSLGNIITLEKCNYRALDRESPANLEKCNITSLETKSKDAQYCLFGDQKVILFTSSLYLAAMVSTFFAVYVSRQRGRKMTIMLASIFYLVGVLLTIASGSIPLSHPAPAFCLLILGRIFLGFGVGFGNQAIPLFISEIAPADTRGALNHLFQLNVTVGIFVANIVNWKAQELHPWGWRLSLGLAGIPTLLLMIGSFFLVETPSSLLQRGLSSQASKVLSIIRGQGNLDTDNLTQDDPLNDNSMNGDASGMQNSKKRFNGLLARSNRPPLVIAIFVQLFQQFTGINVVILYATVLFNSFGSATDESLRVALIISIFNVAFTIFSIFMVDRIGRRRLLIIASIVMFVTQLSIGILLIWTKNAKGWNGKVLVALVCVFVSAFACSWGPLGWLISTEIFPLVCRSEGQGVTVFFNMLFTFLIAHTSLVMLCNLKFGIFFFFAMWAVIMGSFSFLFLPETMNMEMEIINYIWSYHKFWKHFSTYPPTPSPSINSQPPASSSNIEMETLT